jgi:hypothetical protein
VIARTVIPFTFRIYSELIEQLDTWVAEQNVGRAKPLTRSDVIRGVLQWAVRTKPRWEEGPLVIVVQDTSGAVLHRDGGPEKAEPTYTFQDAAGRWRSATLVGVTRDGHQLVATYLAS